jgi:hypothetical protein
MNQKKQEKPKRVAAKLGTPGRTRHGPEPERLKIEGYAHWEDAAAQLVRAKKPPGGWPKR